MRNYKLKIYEQGFTLVELLVATAIFIFVMMTLMSIVTGLATAQKKGIIIQNMQENTRFALEMMGREIKLARKSNTTIDPLGVCVPSGKNFRLASETKLQFINHLNQCVSYELDSNQYYIKRSVDNPPFDGAPEQSGKVTSLSMVKILSLKFAKDTNGNILGDSALDNLQPKVVISLKAQAVDNQFNPIYQIQTTVSQRELDVE